MMVVPVDAAIHETQNIGQQNRDHRLPGREARPLGDFISKTMIVMMTARTPSLNASKRPLVIFESSFQNYDAPVFEPG
jgi:hypothetical protein